MKRRFSKTFMMIFYKRFTTKKKWTISQNLWWFFHKRFTTVGLSNQNWTYDVKHFSRKFMIFSFNFFNRLRRQTVRCHFNVGQSRIPFSSLALIEGFTPPTIKFLHTLHTTTSQNHPINQHTRYDWSIYPFRNPTTHSSSFIWGDNHSVWYTTPVFKQWNRTCNQIFSTSNTRQNK